MESLGVEMRTVQEGLDSLEEKRDFIENKIS